MTLVSISVEHYRGFYDAQTIELASPTGASGSGLTVLVGPNNSGKSTVISALRHVIGGPRQIDLEHRHPGSSLIVTLVDDVGRKKILTNPDLGAVTVIQGDQATYPAVHDFLMVPSRRAWSPYTGQQKMASGQYWQNKIETDDLQDNWLVSRLGDFSAIQRTEFNSLLKKLLPQVSSWRIELSRGQTFILYETSSGARHAADLFGDGMASLFRIALMLFDSKPGSLLGIDEPELSLHPQAQKLLARALSRFAADRQILATTHSPHFINWPDLSHGARVYRLTQHREGVVVGALNPQTVTDLNRLIADWQKPNLLDAVAKEVFFADDVVFVEGQEDVGLLRKFAEDEGIPVLPAFGYGAGGFGNIRYFLRMATELGIPSAAIFDGDHAAAMKEAQQEFSTATIELLPTPDIRDKHRRDERGKELDEIEKVGLFDRQGAIKPEYQKYLRGLLKRLTDALVKQN